MRPFRFCRLSRGPSKLSLELLPQHLPSLRTKDHSDFLLCFDDGHMTPLVGFFVTDLTFGFVFLLYLTLIDLDVFGGFPSIWGRALAKEMGSLLLFFCHCLDCPSRQERTHTVWLLQLVDAFQTMAAETCLVSLLLSLFKLENTSVCLSLLRCWFPFVDHPYRWICVLYHPYRWVCVSERVMDESVSCVALVAS